MQSKGIRRKELLLVLKSNFPQRSEEELTCYEQR